MVLYRRLTHLSQPNTKLLMKMFRLAYFLAPNGPSSSTAALSALKQCLHLDPDSKQCLPAHRLIKAFDKSFKKLDEALSAEKWWTVVDIVVGQDPPSGLAAKYDAALASHASAEAFDLPSAVPVRSPKKSSPRREAILRAMCRAYIQLKQPDKAETWCEQLLQMDGMSNDADGLVGLGEAALKGEEWEDAVRFFETAFESSGRTSRDVSNRDFVSARLKLILTAIVFHRSTNVCRRRRSS